MEETKKKEFDWDLLLDKCEKCGSTNLERLNLYMGHFKKGNPYGLRNKQKAKCLDCQEEFWIEL